MTFLELNKIPFKKVIWESDIQDCTWTKSKTLDLGQWKLEDKPNPTNVLLTRANKHFFPTQKQLETTTYWVKPEDYEYFFLPRFAIRTVNKNGKVVGSEYKLKILS